MYQQNDKTIEIMKTVREFLNKEWEENSGHITKKIISQKSSDRIGSYQNYSDINGLYMAVYDYWDHTVEAFSQVENEKWVGYEIFTDLERTEWMQKNWGESSIRLVLPQWVMNLNAKSERHASNLFRKYLKRV